MDSSVIQPQTELVRDWTAGAAAKFDASIWADIRNETTDPGGGGPLATALTSIDTVDSGRTGRIVHPNGGAPTADISGYYTNVAAGDFCYAVRLGVRRNGKTWAFQETATTIVGLAWTNGANTASATSSTDLLFYKAGALYGTVGYTFITPYTGANYTTYGGSDLDGYGGNTMDIMAHRTGTTLNMYAAKPGYTWSLTQTVALGTAPAGLLSIRGLVGGAVDPGHTVDTEIKAFANLGTLPF